MSERIVIPCELQVIPGGCSTRQNRFCLSASGETVFDEYEHDLSPAQLEVVREVVKAHARLLVKWAND